MRFTVLLIAVVLFTSLSYAETKDQTTCQQILHNRCQKCHYMERICSGVGKKSKRQWKATLKRMVKRRGAVLEGDEQKTLLACLSGQAPEIVKECRP